jgi:hypothetical protein
VKTFLPPLIVLAIAAWPMLGHAEEKIEFNRDIRPILSDNCFFCHGPDKKQRQADLRLDERESALAAGAIVSGKPEMSDLVKRILSTDPDEVMPPADSPKKLTANQKELLRRWIAEGAEYQGHWAYVRPTKPSTAVGKHAIDEFVEKRLSTVGLKPSPEADRRTLARRLSFDLLGLPPRVEEVDAFVADASPDAYEKLVDRLLASPHFGERMALGWLDVVRFSDTIGYHSDTPRNVWPYRDWVIRAFNENKPFDQFTVEQLAGDLLPKATQDQKVASCFNRLLLTTEEGGAQAKDYEARMLGDRVRAVGTVWLGQTLGCCQCHDHKFDPALARDFYSLGAFFADIREPAVGRREDGMNVLDEKQAAELARLVAAVDQLQRDSSSTNADLAAAQQEWEKTVLAELQEEKAWTALHPDKVASEKGVQFKVEKDETIFADRNPKGGGDTYRVTVRTKLRDITGFRLEVLAQSQLPGQGPGRAVDGTFVLTEFSVTHGKNEAVKLSSAAATYEAPGFAAAAAIDGKTDGAKGWSTLGTAGANQNLYVEIEPLPAADKAKEATKELTKALDDLAPEPESTFVFTLQQGAGSDQVLGHFRLSATTQPRPIGKSSVALPPAALIDVVKTKAEARPKTDSAKLADYYRNAAPALAPLRIKLAEARRTQAEFEKTLPKCLVSVAQAPKPVRILPRGNWLDESGELVEPALPKYLAGDAPAADKRPTRLELARWIVARENPLTARVTMNRLWKQFFGMGLSKTLEDLGSQGEPPSHAALLDWLACEFMDSGWDMKHMVRTIVTSRTYRQTSAASKELLARDPENRLLARQGRFRLDAELVRDNAMSISGLLVEKIGGPSTKPYQPEGYWENLNFPVRTYMADSGENQYRRGLYTWWQRSFLHPSLVAFDAPSREECAADRNRSNIPQQALVLLNDPTYVEAARAFAVKILTEAGPSTEARLNWAWRKTLQRTPREDELSVLKPLIEKQQAEYDQNSNAAGLLLHVGQAPLSAQVSPAELAAWTSAARVLLNLHETITRN